MSGAAVIALTATPAGEPACVLEVDGQPLVARVITQLRAVGVEAASVRVLTRAGWVAAVRRAVDVVDGCTVDIEVIACVSSLDVLAAMDPGAPGRLVILHADVMANDLAVARLADHASTRTGALVAGPDAMMADASGRPARVIRGRVVAAASPIHQVVEPTSLSLDAFVVADGDRAAFSTALTRSRTLIEAGQLPPTLEMGSEPALALVALVRSGVPVAAIALPRGLAWSRPDDLTVASAAAAQVAAVDEERVRLDAAVKDQDGFFTTFLVSTYSRFWARAAARKGFTPNQITTASMLLGVVAAGAYAWGTTAAAILGAVALQLAFTLDCVDGQLSRYTRRFSTFGAWLDSVFDRGKEYLVYAGLAIGGVRIGDGEGLWALAAATLVLQTFRHTLDLGYSEQQRADVAREVVRPLVSTAERGSTFWEPSAPSADASLAHRGLGWLRSAEGVPVLKWAKRIVVLPIGERFALISVLAIVAGPRVVFMTLLVWGTFATAYTFGGRFVRSIL